MLTEAIALALKHGTYVFDENGIIGENATFCFDDGDFTPNYSNYDFTDSVQAIKAKLDEDRTGMSQQEVQWRALGPHYTSMLLGTMHRKNALKTMRTQTFLPVDTDWQDQSVEEELTQLGTWLMRDAQRNLPFGCVEAAMGFSTKSLKEREERIEKVFNFLLCSNWTQVNGYRTEKLDIEKGTNPLQTLPRQYGQYPMSAIMPNCLGISAMLCGWCELAEVEYMYVNTIRDRSSVFEEFLATTIEFSIKFCEEQGVTIPEDNKFVMDSELESFTEPYTTSNFHHCVAVKMVDDYWLMLDPYQGVLLPIASADFRSGNGIEETYDTLSAINKVCPGSVISYDSADYESVRLPLEHYGNDSLKSVIDAQLFVEHFADKDEHGVKFFGALHLAVEQGWFKSFWDEVWEECGISGSHLAYPRKRRVKQKRTFYDCMNVWVTDALLNLTTDYQFNSLKKLAELYESDEGFKHRFLEKFQMLPILRLLNRLHDLVYTNYSQYNHFVVELGNPAFQLACNTLNHLASCDQEFAGLIQPFDIAKFSGSQLIWHDALARWYNSEQSEQEAQWEEYLVGQLGRLQMYQWHFRNRHL